MEDVFDALSQQVVGGLFAANAASAEHGDLFVVKAMFVRFPPCGKFTKAGGLRVDGTFERSDGDFVVVAGVNDGDIIATDQVVPVGGLDAVSYTHLRAPRD